MVRQPAREVAPFRRSPTRTVDLWRAKIRRVLARSTRQLGCRLRVSSQRFRGHGIDLLPLTRVGVTEAETLALRLADEGNIDMIVSSPMTRALQTAMILSRHLRKPVDVELDLHEWVPDLSQQWSDGDTPKRAYEELTAFDGEWPPGQRRGWEPYSSVRRRVGAVLHRYSTFGTVAVVCHSVVIEAMTGVAHTGPCGIVPYRPI